jgi:circadian clock protein KaiB
LDVEAEDSWLLRLYVAGRSASLSYRAEANLTSLCEKYLRGRYRIHVIDLSDDPRLAKEHEIVAVPTVVRERPVPFRKVIGDLRDTERTLFGLDLRRAVVRAVVL